MRTLAILVALAAVVTAGCGGASDEAAPPATVAESTPGTVQRGPAPSLEGTTLGGEPIALDEFRGTPVLVNVWSSW